MWTALARSVSVHLSSTSVNISSWQTALAQVLGTAAIRDFPDVGLQFHIWKNLFYRNTGAV